MGFESGKWLIALVLYFVLFFTIAFAMISLDNGGYINGDSNVSISRNMRTQMLSYGVHNYSEYDDATEVTSFTNFIDAISLITGFGINEIDIGFPRRYFWMFNLMFFWIPFVMLLWAIYSAIPFFGN